MLLKRRLMSILLAILMILPLIPIQNQAKAAVVSVGSISVPAHSGGTSSDWMTYDGGLGMAIGETSAQSKMRIVTGTTAAQFDTYCTTLQNNGYTKLFSNSVAAQSGTNKYAKYLSADGTYSVYTYFVPKYSKTFIIVDTHQDSLRKFSYTSSGLAGGRTELYMYSISSSDDGYNYDSEWGSQNRGNAGAMFIIKMSDNSLFVIDGGNYNQFGDRDSEQLYAFMRQITGTTESQKIYINTWFISHLHTDHCAGFPRFLHKYSDKLELQNIMYNFDIEGSSQKYIRRAASLFPNAKYYKPHTGETFTISGVKFDVLYTVEDRYTPTSAKKLILNDASCIGEYTEENNGSTVLRMTFDGKTALLTGDLEKAEAVLMGMYPASALKSDILQIPHHGFDHHADLVQAIAPKISFVNQSEMAADNRSTIYNRIKAMKPYAGTMYFGNSETVGYAANSGVFYRKESTAVDWLNWSARSYELDEANYYDGSSWVTDTDTYYRYTRVTTAPEKIDGTFVIVDDKLEKALSYNTTGGVVGDEVPMLMANDTLYFSAAQRRNVNWRITANPASKTSTLIVKSGGKGYYVDVLIWKDSGSYWGTNTYGDHMAIGRENTYEKVGFFNKWLPLTEDLDATNNNARIDMFQDNTFLIYSRYDATGYHPLFRDPYMTPTAGTAWGTTEITKEKYAEYIDYTALRLYSYQTTAEQLSLRWTGHKDYYATTGVPKNDLIGLLSADVRVYFSFKSSGNSGEIFYDGWQKQQPGTYYFDFVNGYNANMAGDYPVNIYYANASGNATLLGSFTVHLKDKNSNPETKELFFDFNDDADARLRYKNLDQYAGYNFDGASRWQFIEYATDTKVNVQTRGEIDTLSGTARIYTNALNSATKALSMRAYALDDTPLSYKPTYAEVVQIRFKTENLQAAPNSNPYFRLWYYMNDGTTETYLYDNQYNLGTDYVSDGKYTTITMPLYTQAQINQLTAGTNTPTQTFSSCKTITGIRPAFHTLTLTDASKPGCITIDYIYIGPAENAPEEKPNELLFDFDNSDASQERYTDERYNDIDFDGEAKPNWATSETSTTAKVYNDCTVNNSQGVLVVKVAEGLAYETDNSYYGPWVETTKIHGVYVTRTNRTYHAIGYEPQDGDFITVRFKVDGCVLSGSDSAEVVVIYDREIDGVTNRGSYDLQCDFALQNGEYITLTIPANEEFCNADVISNIGLRFRNIKATSAGSGTVTIDYIYVGQEEVLKHDVAFCDLDGNALQNNSVNHGDCVVYNGATPVKAADDENHYTFAGTWQTASGKSADLGRIAADTTVYPQFTAQEHQFTGQGVQMTWACGYTIYVPKEADPIDAVIDYAKPVEIEVRSRATVSGFDEQKISGAPMRAELADANDAVYGDLEVLDKDGDGLLDTLRYTPKQILDKIITAYCVFTVYSETEKTDVEAAVPVRIIPATSVYYETDFSEDAFDFNAYGASGENDQWSIVGQAETEDQDRAQVKDRVDEFVFDRGGEIPSNAFFADFTNDAAAQKRYKTHSIYAKNNAVNERLNFDAVDYWSVNTDHQTTEIINTAAGTLSFTLKNNTRTCAYVQASVALTSGYWLRYHPEKDHYLQIRFKMKNMISLKEDGTATLALHYYIKGNSHEETNDGKDHIYTAGTTTIPKEAFIDGEYITLRVPLTQLQENHNRITALRVYFDYVQSKSATELGEFTIDYVYVGPSATEKNAAAINHESTYAPYLFFNLNNDAYSQKRYKDSIYGGITDYDTSVARWYCATTNPDGSKNENKQPYAVSGGLTFEAGARINDDNEYSNYFAPTKNAKNFPWTTSSDYADYPLNFVANTNLSYYAIVRFKASDMTAVGTPKLQVTLMDGKGGVKYPTANVTGFKVGEFSVVVIDITSHLKALNGVVKGIYLRFGNLKPAKTTAYGRITVDYIYIGPENTGHKANYSSITTEKNVFIDFRNTTYDQQRYKARIYGNNNFDVAAGWNNTYWYNYNIDTATGVLKLTPTSNYTNWGQIEANTSGREAFMSYEMTSKTYAVVRMRCNSLTTNGTLAFTFGTGSTGRLPSEGADSYEVTQTIYTSNNGKWVTYKFNLGAYASTFEHLTFFRIIWANSSLGSGGSIELDYIYIGELLQGDPPEDALYFGFDKLSADNTRYSSKTYNYVNYDTAGTSNFEISNLASATVNNTNGTLTLTASEGSYNTFAFATQNSLNFHTKGKTLQIRFKTEDFVADNQNPYFRLDYGSGNTAAFSAVRYDSKYLSNGKYVTITVELTPEIAAAFNNANTVSKLRFYFGGMKNAENKQGKIIVDYIYIGPKDGKFENDLIYGYDSSYNNDGIYSNGSSYKVEGLGIPTFNSDYTTSSKIYTESSFDFTGTGFDIISRTGVNQGLVRVMVYDQNGKMVKSAQVLNKSDANRETYQVPVLAVRLDEYGSYTAKVYVAAAYDFTSSADGQPDGDQDIFSGALDRGGEFYFDAVRIYNPIDTTAGTEEAEAAYDAYLKHGEADPTFKEVRNILLEPDGYTAVGSQEGVLYFEPAKDKDGNLIAKYEETSPNNEVYLNAGKAVAFKLEVTGSTPASVDVGVKCIDGTAASMILGVGKNAPSDLPSEEAKQVTGTSTQYFELEVEQWNTDGEKSWIYVTIYNNSTSGMISITNLKHAYDTPATTAMAATRSVRFVADRELMQKLTTPCDHVWDNGTLLREASCLSSGEKVYACANCDEIKTEEIARFEHTYVDGKCICGAKLAKEPIFDENLSFNMSIGIGAEMQVFYTIMNSKVKNFERFYLEVVKESANGECKSVVYSLDENNLAENIIPATGMVAGYSATYSGIFASMMGDRFTATLYAVAQDGTTYYGESVSSSIKDGLYEKLENENSSAELKTLAVDMLNYGAAAQIYFGYDTEHLVNADLTDAQKALGTQTIPEAMDSSFVVGEGIDVKTDVSLQSKVLLYINCTYACSETSDLTFVIKDTVGNVLDAFAPSVQTDKLCQGVYGNVGAKQMRSLITIELYDNDALVSKTVTWNIEGYVAQVRAAASDNDAKLNIVNAMLIYGDSAAAYLASASR